MNADIRQIKTTAEQGLADTFAGARDRLPGATILAMREAAFETFQSKGLPHRRVEEWKYTDLRTLMRDAKPLAAPPDAAAKARAKDAGKMLGNLDRRRIVIVDGSFVAELSDLARLESGLRIASLADALGKDPDAVKDLGRIMPMDGDPAVALNTALMGDGAVIHIADGAQIERPIHLAFVTTGAKATAAYIRSLVFVGNGARATLMETHEGPNGVDYQINNALELKIGDKATVGHVKILLEGDKALHISSLMTAIGADVTYDDMSFVAGGAVVRNQLAAQFGGENTTVNLRGVSLLRDRQHVDTTLVADHAKGHCTGREFFRSVLADQTRSVFQGKIIVRQHAQKTDSKMMSNSLLLSEDAEADNKPELEIFADDVICGHGATAGALDEDLLFYLKARGIPAHEAESLLIQAFIGEVVEALGDDNLKDALMAHTRDWLAARG